MTYLPGIRSSRPSPPPAAPKIDPEQAAHDKWIKTLRQAAWWHAAAQTFAAYPAQVQP